MRARCVRCQSSTKQYDNYDDIPYERALFPPFVSNPNAERLALAWCAATTTKIKKRTPPPLAPRSLRWWCRVVAQPSPLPSPLSSSSTSSLSPSLCLSSFPPRPLAPALIRPTPPPPPPRTFRPFALAPKELRYVVESAKLRRAGRGGGGWGCVYHSSNFSCFSGGGIVEEDRVYILHGTAMTEAKCELQSCLSCICQNNGG